LLASRLLDLLLGGLPNFLCFNGGAEDLVIVTMVIEQEVVLVVVVVIAQEVVMVMVMVVVRETMMVMVMRALACQLMQACKLHTLSCSFCHVIHLEIQPSLILGCRFCMFFHWSSLWCNGVFFFFVFLIQ
jgi:hypothetical protein